MDALATRVAAKYLIDKAAEGSIERPTPSAAGPKGFKPGDKVKVTKGKEKGLTGIVKYVGSGPHGNQVSVELDHPVHRMMGPAILDPGALEKTAGLDPLVQRVLARFQEAGEHVNLTPKEIARKDNTGHTVVVRPQAGGGYMVAVVEIQGDKGRLMGKPYTQYVKDQSEVPKATKEVVRMLSKLGFPSDMSDASRHRHADAPVAAEEEPEESTHNPWEKRGEWNLNVYHPGGRRNLSYFMKNPQGGGGGGNTSTSSAKQVVDMAIRGTGWSSPHINKDKKDKVWVTVLQMDGEDWKPMKSWWQPIPPELLNKPEKKLTDHEYWEMATR